MNVKLLDMAEQRSDADPKSFGRLFFVPIVFGEYTDQVAAHPFVLC